MLGCHGVLQILIRQKRRGTVQKKSVNQRQASRDWSPEWGIVQHATVSDVNSTKDKPVKAMLLASFCEESCAEHVFILNN